MERLGLGPRKAAAACCVRAVLWERVWKSCKRRTLHFSVYKGQNANCLALLKQERSSQAHEAKISTACPVHSLETPPRAVQRSRVWWHFEGKHLIHSKANLAVNYNPQLANPWTLLPTSLLGISPQSCLAGAAVCCRFKAVPGSRSCLREQQAAMQAAMQAANLCSAGLAVTCCSQLNNIWLLARHLTGKLKASF